jgi:hypothetical protein
MAANDQHTEVLVGCEDAILPAKLHPLQMYLPEHHVEMSEWSTL